MPDVENVILHFKGHDVFFFFFFFFFCFLDFSVGVGAFVI